MAEIKILDYVPQLKNYIGDTNRKPWEILSDIDSVIEKKLRELGDEYNIKDKVAIHKDAIVEANVIFKGPVIINKKCFVAANCYFRSGVILGADVTIGPSCEIKTSIILDGSTIAHMNYVGDSIVGSDVNLEGEAVIANHFNEYISDQDKIIKVMAGDELISTGVIKFGALIGDNSKLGANSVTSPGTILKPGSIIGRLELIKQH